LRKHIKVTEIFAKERTTPIFFNTDKNLFFQDSLQITGCSLDKTVNEYNLKTHKTKDLDYTQPRNSMTILSKEEINYIVNDVIILNELYTWLTKNYVDNGLPIPYTKTGILRDTVKYYYKKWIMNSQYVDKRKNQWLISLMPKNFTEFNLNQKYLFRGGYTHSNIKYVDMLLTDINGVDFTSSYPACILLKKFPMTEFIECGIKDIDKIIETSEKYAYKVWIKFKGLKSTTNHSLESISKILEYDHIEYCNKNIKKFIHDYGATVDNGRLMSCEGTITVYLTDLDLKLYKKYYTWKNYEILSCERSLYSELPQYLTDVVTYFYIQKAKLKKLGLDETTQYKLAKAMVNAAYGMMCEHLHLENWLYSDEWELEKPLTKREREELYKKEIFGDYEKVKANLKPCKKFLSMYWGIWTTAHARYNLLNTLIELNDDGLYCDTDSIYCKNYEQHEKLFEKYNNKIYQKTLDYCNMYNNEHDNKIEYDLIKDLGEFDKINKIANYSSFKMLGAKRYIKTGLKKNNDGKYYLKTEQTIAGLPKTKLIELAVKTNQNVYDLFNDELKVKKCKNAHMYNDFEHTDIITDLQGHTEEMTELSSVGIFSVDFSLSLADEFTELIILFAEKNKQVEYKTSGT